MRIHRNPITTDNDEEGRKIPALRAKEPHMADVRVSKANELQWDVLLEGVVVGRFVIATEALNYASLLECDPRERDLALAS
jgi:hypothetical protein